MFLLGGINAGIIAIGNRQYLYTAFSHALQDTVVIFLTERHFKICWQHMSVPFRRGLWTHGQQSRHLLSADAFPNHTPVECRGWCPGIYIHTFISQVTSRGGLRYIGESPWPRGQEVPSCSWSLTYPKVSSSAWRGEHYYDLLGAAHENGLLHSGGHWTPCILHCHNLCYTFIVCNNMHDVSQCVVI